MVLRHEWQEQEQDIPCLVNVGKGWCIGNGGSKSQLPARSCSVGNNDWGIDEIHAKGS